MVALSAAAWALLALAATLAAWALASRPRRPPGAVEPPYADGGIPLLGNALQLGRGGAAFVAEQRRRHGDVLTVLAAGQRLTFVFAPESLLYYFTAPDSQLAFTPAVERFTHRIFGLPPEHFLGKHLAMLRALRGLLAPGALRPLGSELLATWQQELQRLPPAGELDLVSLVQRLVFRASVPLLFGRGFVKRNGAGHLQQQFEAFDGGFELAASPVPHLLQRRFGAARRALLTALRASHQAGEFEGTVAGQLAEACGLPGAYVPNMLLALLWASQANTGPAAFWAVAFLLLPENQAHRGAALRGARRPAERRPRPADGQHAGSSSSSRAEPRRAAAGREGQLSTGQAEELLGSALDRGSALALAASEALRLRSVVMDVRVAAAEVALPLGDGRPPAWIRKGSVVAMCPSESHQDSRLYLGGSPPDAFDPGRPGMRLGGSAAQHGAVVGVGGLPGLSFGGGKYRCPGRYFAEMEVPLLAGLLLTALDLQLLPKPAGPAGGNSGGGSGGGRSSSGGGCFPGDPGGRLPPPDTRRMVGLQTPAAPCRVRYAKRAACE